MFISTKKKQCSNKKRKHKQKETDIKSLIVSYCHIVIIKCILIVLL